MTELRTESLWPAHDTLLRVSSSFCTQHWSDSRLYLLGWRTKVKGEGDITFITIATISVLFYDLLEFKCSGITIANDPFNINTFVKLKKKKSSFKLEEAAQMNKMGHVLIIVEARWQEHWVCNVILFLLKKNPCLQPYIKVKQTSDISSLCHHEISWNRQAFSTCSLPRLLHSLFNPQSWAPCPTVSPLLSTSKHISILPNTIHFCMYSATHYISIH